MALDLDTSDKNFPRVLAAKQAMAQAVFTASIRSDASSFRKQTNDRLGELIEKVKELTKKP